MLYKFIDRNGTFTVKEPSAVSQSAYLPLTDAAGALLSSISPNLAGDIKADNDSLLPRRHR